MRRVAWVLCLLLGLPGCGWFIRSFRGPPGGTDEPLIGVRSYPYVVQCTGGFVCGGETITVRIVQSDRTFAHCTGVASGIDCEFPSAYLMEFAAMGQGGWLGLTYESATKVCLEAMRTVPIFPDAVNGCAWSLVEMRFKEAMPPTEGDKNQ